MIPEYLTGWNLSGEPSKDPKKTTEMFREKAEEIMKHDCDLHCEDVHYTSDLIESALLDADKAGFERVIW
jgi:hypothetical protein